MKPKPDIHIAARKFVNRFIRNRKPRRLHLSKNLVNLKDISEMPQKTDDKPIGIWYGIGDSWIDWCVSEGFGGIHQYIYEVVVNESRILTIDNMRDFEKFENEHHDLADWRKELQKADNLIFQELMLCTGRKSYLDSMNYGNVAKSFDGIEITPYQWEKRLESMWYYGWDCASGCIWNPDAITELNLFAQYDVKKNEFVKVSLQTDKMKV